MLNNILTSTSVTSHIKNKPFVKQIIFYFSTESILSCIKSIYHVKMLCVNHIIDTIKTQNQIIPIFLFLTSD